MSHESSIRMRRLLADRLQLGGQPSPSLATPPLSPTSSTDDIQSQFDDAKLPASPAPQTPLDAIPLDVDVEVERISKSGKLVLRVDDELRKLLGNALVERDQPAEENKRRRRFGDLVFVPRYTAFDRNSDQPKSPFHGFFVLLWLGVFIAMLKTVAETYRETGQFLSMDILSIMFEPNQLFDCLLTDFIMYFGCTLFCVPLQRAVAANNLSWNSTGWILQSIWELTYLVVVIAYTVHKDWRWIQSVFIALHLMVVIMKQHSYAFYNGYLSEVHKRRRVLSQKLSELQDAGAVVLPVQEPPSHLRHRRHSSLGTTEDLKDLTQDKHLSPHELTTLAALISREIEECSQELTSESPNSPRTTYPHNLTYLNFIEYLHFPTVVYELTYPRHTHINWSYIAEKTAATFGVLGIMIVVSQTWIYPVVIECISLRQLPLPSRLAEFPWILLRLIFPFMAEYILSWYLIWEIILNLLGEMTRFADRGFSGPWYNSTSWDSFARDWNTPVHNFLLRHVYHSSISTFRISRKQATLVTFLLSAVVHELVMWCIFKKLRGYLLVLQMAQLPLVSLARSRWMRGRDTLGNVLFWIGIWCGPAFLSSGYLIL